MEPGIFDSYRQWLDSQKMPKGKKAALLSAMTLFSQQGFDGTSTVQIAEEAGISQATIFKYFHTKQDLLTAIVRPVMEHFFPRYRDEFFKGINAQMTLPEIVSFIVHDRYAFIKANQEAVKIIIMEMMTNQEMRGLFKKMLSAENFNFLSEVFKAFRRTGQLRDDVDAAGIIRIIAGQMIVYVVQSTYAPDFVGDEAADLDLISNQVVRALQK